MYEPINKTKYYLKSILIHSGSHDSGHYYSFNYDFNEKLWRRYNDSKITIE